MRSGIKLGDLDEFFGNVARMLGQRGQPDGEGTVITGRDAILVWAERRGGFTGLQVKQALEKYPGVDFVMKVGGDRVTLEGTEVETVSVGGGFIPPRMREAIDELSKRGFRPAPGHEELLRDRFVPPNLPEGFLRHGASRTNGGEDLNELLKGLRARLDELGAETRKELDLPLAPVLSFKFTMTAGLLLRIRQDGAAALRSAHVLCDSLQRSAREQPERFANLNRRLVRYNDDYELGALGQRLLEFESDPSSQNARRIARRLNQIVGTIDMILVDIGSEVGEAKKRSKREVQEITRI
ncbi:MAG TPA: hypothetical protein VN495_01460 [Candidatus Paceibacterota bacterium]|nr:hypothetical protein [Candidatus Paceibacterota bacterium]